MQKYHLILLILIVLVEGYNIGHKKLMDELQKLKEEKEALEKQVEALKVLQKQPEEVFFAAPKGLITHTINHTNDLIYWANEKAEIVYANDAVAEQLGYSKDELLKLKIADIYGKFSKIAWFRFWITLKKEKTLTKEEEFITKEGDHFPVEMSVTFLTFENQDYICAIVRDITRRKYIELQLKYKEAHKKALLSAIPDLIYIMSKDGFYMDFRGGNGNSFISPEAVIGSNIKQSGLDEKLINQILERNLKVIQTNEIESLQYHIQFPDGKIRYYEDRAVKYSDNQVIRVVREVTEMIDSQMDLQRIN